MCILNQFTHTLYTNHLPNRNLIINSMQIFLVPSVSHLKKCSDFITFCESVTEKIISNGTDMSESMKDSQTIYALVEHCPCMHRTASNEIINVINEENGIIAPVLGKKFSTLRGKFCEEEAFSYLLSNDKDRVGYDASRYILISPSFTLIKGC